MVALPQITWNILGPNSNEVLPSVNTDIGEPVNGSFNYKDGEGGLRVIQLQILPHGEVEVEETFVVKLRVLSGEMDIDPRAGSVTLRVCYYCLLQCSIMNTHCFHEIVHHIEQSSYPCFAVLFTVISLPVKINYILILLQVF